MTAIVFGFGTQLPLRAAPLPAAGTYQHEEMVPGPEGTTGVITYTVELRRSGKTHVGWIRYEGYQNPGTVLKCRVRERAQAVDLHFVSYGDGATKNRSGVRQYAPGVRLATLRPTSRRGKPGALLYWHALTPPDGRARLRGTFFVRSRG